MHLGDAPVPGAWLAWLHEPDLGLHRVLCWSSKDQPPCGSSGMAGAGT